MVSIIVVGVLFIGLMFVIFKQHFDQKLKEEEFEFQKKVGEITNQMLQWKSASQVSPEELEKAVAGLKKLQYYQQQSEDKDSLIKELKQKVKAFEKQKEEESKLQKIAKKNAEKVFAKAKKKGDEGVRNLTSSFQDSSSNSLDPLTMLFLMEMINQDSQPTSQSESYSGDGGGFSGGGASSSYDDSSSSSDHSSSSYDSSSSSYDSGGSSDSGGGGGSD